MRFWKNLYYQIGFETSSDVLISEINNNSTPLYYLKNDDGDYFYDDAEFSSLMAEFVAADLPGN